VISDETGDLISHDVLVIVKSGHMIGIVEPPDAFIAGTDPLVE
jgi:hypothetical protein